MISAQEAMQRLRMGNVEYLDSDRPKGDISRILRLKTARDGQNPYAIIITCSDSRVIPEDIFSAGIGELFVIRLAGNVIDQHQLGSIEYAAEHLGVKLILVMGHTHCGAVSSAMEGHSGGFIGYVLKDIQAAIGSEKDDFKASSMNVQHGMAQIRRELGIHPIRGGKGVEVHGAVYDIETGEVHFLDESRDEGSWWSYNSQTEL